MTFYVSALRNFGVPLNFRFCYNLRLDRQSTAPIRLLPARKACSFPCHLEAHSPFTFDGIREIDQRILSCRLNQSSAR
jgi:hypothetical protein